MGDSSKATSKRYTPLLPELPILVMDAKQACTLTTDGEVITTAIPKVSSKQEDFIVCHAPYTSQRLGLSKKPRFDILELFLFACPAQFCVPTPKGLATNLGIDTSEQLEDQAMSMIESIQSLLHIIHNDPHRDDLIKLARYMKDWAWAPFVLQALECDPSQPYAPIIGQEIAFWKKLPKWEQKAPKPDPTQFEIEEKETTQLLNEWLSLRPHAEKRSDQISYASTLTHAFKATEEDKEMHAVLAEAGTGIGKTLGYLAPAKLWAEKNDGTVWISTYTKNLQTQILQEGKSINLNIHARKGRENYLCLLNLEEQVKRAAVSTNPYDVVTAGLMLRWMMVTKDGDLSGADFPGWIMGLLGIQNSLSLGDRRGECIHAACDHYNTCFIEHAIRTSKDAPIVVSNHALIMYLSALGDADESLPTRFVFDEGHHLFDAADSAYAAHLSAREGAELRRWLLGAEGSRRSRARGLAKRLEGFIEADDTAQRLLNQITRYAHVLPPQNWPARIYKNEEDVTPTEAFLRHVAAVVRVRNKDKDSYYSLETSKSPISDIIVSTGRQLAPKLRDLKIAIQSLSKHFQQKLNDEAEDLSADTRKRLNAIIQNLHTRAEIPLTAWAHMLDQLDKPTPKDFVDWFSIDRVEGRDADIGMCRHWIDPMRPFAANMESQTDGMVVTSATLRDREDSWDTGMLQTGLNYFNATPIRFNANSPFDYEGHAKILIVNDLKKGDLRDLATGYREMMIASNGGALGIFTAIKRLKSVHEYMHEELAALNIPLHAQHIDNMDIGTMIDIFRSEENACLLGTDAIRDGVDVPGNSLRMIIFDKVPWPRPTLLHKARRENFGGRSYDEALTRLKLKQAFGRLIRTKTDKGVFVIMDGMMPSRLLNAFPEDINIQRVGLKEAIEVSKNFLHN